ncbi:Guanine nucleotide exchange factor for Cdc42p [Malassezia obtusa]|uniref:Guanine nucleotide exchange factor for Cdc42p n=1 Tax=Malassezia obtusa TaxID=76774 RepID=A0AAF0DYJ7_9BASI|nr:Guanine nucleotide exchange factor for Cdc42p [Malassezia obtusa]
MGGASDGGFGTSTPTLRAVPTAPIPANTLTNKQASPGSGLYQSCVTLRERLWCVPGFGAEFLEPSAAIGGTANGRPNGMPPIQFDPVTHLWQCFRLGTPLCKLYNQLSPRLAEIPLTVENNLSNANACKALVMRFLIALKEKLGWDPDDTFTVSQLYLNDTNGFVRVIRTVNKLLDLLAEHGVLLEVAPSPGHISTDFLNAPPDQRMHVVRELLESERKYVHDLEVMQNYAMALSQTGLLSADTIYLLFGNLNQLVDVQRRFLICVEDNARRPPTDQRFGSIFRDMEDDFSVYEPFCANYAQALDVISSESQNLSRAKLLPAVQSCYLDPSYELPTFMIKPVQRICKYPLLLEQLLKNTPKDTPGFEELAAALPIIRRITDKVNETSRRQENIQAVKDLEMRVEDWKGHSLKSFGDLLLSDVFLVSKGESERDFQVYLFEKILLCCKDLGASGSSSNPLSSGSSRGRSKNNSLLKQRQGSFTGSVAKKDQRSPLQLKGRIFMNNIVGINAVGRAGGFPDAPIGSYSLQVWWRGESEVESFSLKCKNDEQLRLWQGALQRLLDDLTLRRQQSVSQATTPTTSAPPHPLHLNLAGTQYPRSATRGAFMQVATPVVGTPGADYGMPRRLRPRDPSQSSQRSDDELPSELPSGMATPTFAAPTRSYTETDAIAMLEGRSSLDDRAKPLHEAWANYVPRTPRDESHQAGLVSSPKSLLPPTKPPTASAGGAPVNRTGFAPNAPSTANPGMPTHAQASVLARSSSAAPVPRVKKSVPAQLIIPNDALDQELHGMNLGYVPVQRTGFAAGRAAAHAAQNNATHMQRTASDGAAIRTSAFEEPQTPASSSPLGGWNPYFPSIPGTQTPGGAEGRSTSFGDVMRSGGTVSRAGSNSLHSSPATRNTSEGSVAGPASSSSSVANFPGALDPYATPATPGSPPLLAPMHVRLAYGGSKSQFFMPDTASYPVLYEQIKERVAPHRAKQGLPDSMPDIADAKLRMYYVDEDGDRVLMLDDDDLAMALDHSRLHRRNQLDVIVE